MKNVKVVVFDKTGTLTEGRWKSQTYPPLNGNSIDDVLRISASLESHSKHPLAKAILKKAKEVGCEIGRGP
jgi:Cd2+/Zn2+-exporting ATPase